MENFKILWRIQNIADQMNYYGYLNMDRLKMFKENFNGHGANDHIAELICAEFSDQDGNEVNDAFFEAVLELLEL